MILLVVEGRSDQVFFDHVLNKVLKANRSEVRIKSSNGIDKMLIGTLPDACKLLGTIYTKVIAAFDVDEMKKRHTQSKRRIQRLEEILRQYPQAGGFPVRDNLEDLIGDCLPKDQRRSFRKRVKAESKVVAAEWALKQELNETELKSRVADLEASLNCNLQKVFHSTF